MKKFNIYKQVINPNGRDHHQFLGVIDALNRNDACLKFRFGEVCHEFLTAVEIKENVKWKLSK